MKYCIIIILTSLIPNMINAQKKGTKNEGFGFAINSGFNTELNVIGLVPSALYHKAKNQLELGLELHPFVLKNQRILGGEFNYKYFPNGADKKYNLFLNLSCGYINQYKKAYYPATYQYFFLSGGYGMQIKLIKGSYLATSFNLGTFTKSKRTENPYKNYIGTKKTFKDFGMNLTFKVGAGYRF